MERTTLHIVCGNSRSRAEQARIVFALGHHAEVYAELDELLDRPPPEGIVLACDHGDEATAERLIERLGKRGIWLPVVMAAEDPATSRVVAAIKAGALDYLPLPLEMGTFARQLHAILNEAGQHAERRRREVEAQRDIALLSRRERQVLELLSAGCSNKEIARWLTISPRTVEIHRGNMMTKLGAGHPADVVRLWMDAHLNGPRLESAEPEDVAESADDLDRGIVGRIGEQRRLADRRAQDERRTARHRYRQ